MTRAHPLRFLLLSSLITVMLAGCSPSEPPNVILITLDTLRADHIGAYGYDRSTLPQLEAFMADAVRFEAAESVTPLTAPSHATMMTGLYPAAHGATQNGFVLTDDKLTLAEVLSEAGYRTGAFVAAQPAVGKSTGFPQGFDEFEDGNVKRRSAPDVMDDALAFLGSDDPAPFFMWAHFYDIHCPYSTPKTFPVTFSLGIPSRIRTIGACDDDLLIDGLDDDDVALIRARYDEGISFVDLHLQRLWDHLAAAGLAENTVVIVTSDHGEELHEQGNFGHNYTVNEWETHIPLWIRMPGGGGPATVAEPVSTVDYFPTIIDLVGLDPIAEVEGLSLKPLLTGSGKSLRRTLGDRAVFARVMRDGKAAGRPDDAAIRRGDWKLHTYPDVGTSALYDLGGRGAELADDVRDRPGLRHELKTELDWWMTNQDHAFYGNSEQKVSDEVKRQLEALGY